ncbi:hypothetical protein [Streptomyces sp. WM6372]|uniref:hypothetical protein n=1 Tax=Streptomyces sp. WM6372 TaxID=1415555 RepID=UPI0018FE6A84|nr:hypothetical protein [Streptomyces sp. WM6372]
MPHLRSAVQKGGRLGGAVGDASGIAYDDGEVRQEFSICLLARSVSGHGPVVS